MLPPNPRDIPALYKQALALHKTGRAEQALALLNRIRLVQPRQAEVLFQIGRLEAESGHGARAETVLREALALKPKEPAIWQALHGVLSGKAAAKLEREAGKAGVFLGAEADLKPVVSMVSRDPVAGEAKALAAVRSAPAAFWPAFVLGRARVLQGKWAAALGPLEMAHSRNPTHAEAQIELGRCLAELDRPIRAEALLRPHVPASVVASLALGRLYLTSLRAAEALDVLDRVPAKAKTGPAVLRLRILCHAALKQVSAVEACLRKLPKNKAMVADAARTLEEAGADEAALRLLTQALAQTPDDPDLRTHRAQLRQSSGDFDGAGCDLQHVFERASDQPEAYRAYMAGQKLREGDPIWAQLQAQLRRPDLSARSRWVMNFAAAKAYGDLGQDHEMFDALHRANRLMSEAYPYGFEADLAEARALAADWARLKDMPVSGPSDPVLFVTGLPRSGTTLVETILAAHPKVAAGGEMPFLGRALAPAKEELRNARPDPDLFARAGALYLDAARSRTGSNLFADKAISTFSQIGHTVAALPGARIIVLQRDPRDIGLSIYRNMFPAGRHRYSTDLAAIGKYIRLHEALVAFWRRQLPSQVHVVAYEDLTKEPEPHIRALLGFAGLPWDAACLHPERASRRIQTLSFAQARQPISQGSVAGWRRYEAHLAPLLEALERTEIDLTGTA